DRVAIYMPMVPEALVAMLACARLGVMHSVVFAGYSAPALKARIEDAQATLVITTDGQYRRGKAVSLKEAVDEAVRPGPDDEQSPVQHVLVVRRTGIDVPWTEGRDLWWHHTVANASPEHTPRRVHGSVVYKGWISVSPPGPAAAENEPADRGLRSAAS